MSDQERIEFTLTDSGEKVFFYVIEETRINNTNYILVAESDEDEAEAYILREAGDEPADGREREYDAVYDIVEDEEELEAISAVFAQLLEDFEIEFEDPRD